VRASICNSELKPGKLRGISLLSLRFSEVHPEVYFIMRDFVRLSEFDHGEFYCHNSLRNPWRRNKLSIPQIAPGLWPFPDLRIFMLDNWAHFHKWILLLVCNLLPSNRQVHPDWLVNMRFGLLFWLLLLQCLQVKCLVSEYMRLPSDEDSECDLLWLLRLWDHLPDGDRHFRPLHKQGWLAMFSILLIYQHEHNLLNFILYLRAYFW